MSSNVFDPGADELSRACRIDAACDRFETAWKTGNRPRIEDHLGGIAGPERLVLARELILLDIHYRRLAGQPCLVSEYDSRFPDLDPTWLASVISARTGGSLTPTASRPPGAPANGLITTNNGETISLLATDSLQSFGDYEIRGVIGASGMGVVYKAWQRSLNRLVALKTIRHGRGLSRSAVERFRAEAEMAAHLDHPNIVPIYEVSEHEGQPYFTMKLIEGVDLARLPPGFTEDQRAVARLVATAARAVHHAHQRGILHRDLKPANILLEWPAGTDHPPVPHVADFGLAKRLDVDMHLSLEDGLVGTPVYMAPEQALRKSDLTTAVDVHGLGAVLYFLLTGQPPFKAETILETVQQVIEREPARPRSLKPGVDRDLEIICLRCLEKRPQDRLRSAEEVTEELDRWLAGKPIQSRSASTPEKILKWVRRRPAVAALLAVSMVAMLALVGVGVGLWYSAQLQTVNEGLDAANRDKDDALGKLETALQAVRNGKEDAESERQRARRFLYVSQINLTDRAYKEGKPGLALQLLESLRPQDMGGEDLRGPEWYQLWSVCRGYIHALTGHTSPITAMEFSPDGKWLAAGAADGSVIIWDTSATKIHQTLPGKGSSVSALQFTEDSRILVAARKLEALGAWDVLSGREFLFSGGAIDVKAEHTLNGLVVSQKDRQSIASAYLTTTPFTEEWLSWILGAVGQGSGFHAVLGLPPRVIECPKNEPWKGRGEMRSIASTPDSGLVFAAFAPVQDDRSLPDGYLLLVDRRGNDPLARSWRATAEVTCVALDGHGESLAWADMDRIIHVSDIGRNHSELLFSHNARPQCLAISPDNRYLASAHTDHVIRIWELLPPRAHVVFNVRDHRVNNVVFSPLGNQIAACCPHSIEIWEITNERSVRCLSSIPRKNDGDRCRLSYSPDGHALTNGKCVIGVPGGSVLSSWKGSEDGPFSAVFSADGRLVASAYSNAINGSEATTGKIVRTFKPLPEFAVCVAFSPDRKLLAAGSCNIRFNPGGIKVWELATGREVYAYAPARLGTFCVAFSPDGKWLAAGRGSYTDLNEPGEVKIWDTQTWRETVTLEGHTKCVWSVAFSHDALRLASAGGNRDGLGKPNSGEIIIWDLTIGQELLALRGHSGCVHGVSFSPNGKVLVSGSADGTIRLWGDLTSLKP
jgi:serine/threonine-protein kinase